MTSWLVRALHALCVVAMAICLATFHGGCKDPALDMRQATYDAEVMKCVHDSDTLQQSCECRKDLDEKFGLCDHPPYPMFGRCDFACEDQPNVPLKAPNTSSSK